MLRTWLTWSVAALCICVGLGLSAYKLNVLSFPFLPDASVKSWYVELHTTLKPSYRHRAGYSKEPTEVSIILPSNTARYAVIDTQTIANNFGEQAHERDGIAATSFIKRKPDSSESVYVRFTLYELDVNESSENSVQGVISNNPYIKKQRVSDPDGQTKTLYASIDALLEEVTDKSSSARSFVMQLAKILKKNKNKRRYLMRATESSDIYMLLNILSEVAGYKTRVANGLMLDDVSRSTDAKRWLEVRHNDRWYSFDAEKLNYITDKDHQLYRWWIGTIPLIKTTYYDTYIASISVKPNTDSSLTRALWNAREAQPFVHYFALQTLPLDQQLVLQILLLMPLGALMVSFFRQVIGLRTFGTFLPILVALAFRETGIVFGVIFFVSLISVGLILRSYLARLRLLMVPRLSAVLTIVVGLIALAMIVSRDSNIPLGISVALFPVVIITMFIERMSTVWDERGPRDALLAAAGSVITACIIYLCIMNEEVKHILLTFPELLLVLFAGCLILGRYNGFKLTEYLRFRQLRHSLEKQEKAE